MDTGSGQAYAWRASTREQLTELLPEALVVLPVGATEQHGPHLATATDALMAETVAWRAAERAALQGCPRPLVVAPVLAFGASDHHLPFGGTLSLRPETLLDVLLDLARSIAACGGRRLILVNGHGGNRGICSAAIAAASVRHPGLSASYVDYWSLLTDGSADRDGGNAGNGGTGNGADATVPGHAGRFETALVLAVEPELVRMDLAAARPNASIPRSQASIGSPVETARQADWTGIDGYTDDPAAATVEEGRQWSERLIGALAGRLRELASG